MTHMSSEERLRLALLDPGSVYACPAEVLADLALPAAQKIEVLRRWEYDACEDSDADDEGTPGGNGPLLAQILRALDALGVEIHSDHTAPTKQGGLDREAVIVPSGS